ncbi:MAG: hypothetical protein IPK75_19935 [Acidobacteria bacterium]|nr:hypothetical protein [Acidobacteriota bacterium]
MFDTAAAAIVTTAYDPDATVGLAASADVIAKEARDLAATAAQLASQAGAASIREWGPFTLVDGIQVYPLPSPAASETAVTLNLGGVPQVGIWEIDDTFGPSQAINLLLPVKDNPGENELQAGLKIWGKVTGGIIESAIPSASIFGRHFHPGAIDLSGPAVADGPPSRRLETDQNGRPFWREPVSASPVDVREYGLSPDATATENTAAILSAIAANPGGAELRIPPGTYSIQPFSVTGKSRIILSGSPGTVFQSLSDGDDITFSGCAYSGLRGIDFQPAVKKTNGFSVRLTNGCFRCSVEDVRIFSGWNGIDVFGSTECRVSRVHVRSMLGANPGVRYTGSSGFRSYRLIISDLTSDNPYPYPWGSRKLWTIGTAYAQGAILINAGNIYQCSVAGTSATTGTGPSGIPGTTPATAFTSQITDGGCKWRFVANMFATPIVYDPMPIL